MRSCWRCWHARVPDQPSRKETNNEKICRPSLVRSLFYCVFPPISRQQFFTKRSRLASSKGPTRAATVCSGLRVKRRSDRLNTTHRVIAMPAPDDRHPCARKWPGCPARALSLAGLAPRTPIIMAGEALSRVLGRPPSTPHMRLSLSSGFSWQSPVFCRHRTDAYTAWMPLVGWARRGQAPCRAAGRGAPGLRPPRPPNILAHAAPAIIGLGPLAGIRNVLVQAAIHAAASKPRSLIYGRRSVRLHPDPGSRASGLAGETIL